MQCRNENWTVSPIRSRRRFRADGTSQPPQSTIANESAGVKATGYLSAALLVMRGLEGRHLALPFGFTSPATVCVGRTKLGVLLAAVISTDRGTLAAMRADFTDDAGAFDRFVAGVRGLATGAHATAWGEFARLESAPWQVPAAVLGALALAASGELRRAIAASNQIGDVIRASGRAGARCYPGDAALLREGVRCLAIAEAASPAPDGHWDIAPTLRFVVAYPRSGSTLLLQIPLPCVCGPGLLSLSRRFAVFLMALS
jgi:hypothetical protein